MNRRKKFIYSLFVVLFFFIFCDLILQFFTKPSYILTTRYGWVLPENTTHQFAREDSPGDIRTVNVQYFQNGFKRWGNVQTNKIKIFIIGDSFTQMNYVSNGEEWYAYLEKSFTNLELFVYGGGGYGNLQEFMILDDFLDVIQPDLILLQFCRNDFQNNLYELDLLTYPCNNHFIRPYLENDKIVYRLPLAYSTIRNYSYFADRLLRIYDVHLAKNISKQDFVSTNTKLLNKKYNTTHEKAKDTTSKILSMFKTRAGVIPLYVFGISDRKELKHIFESNSFTIIPGILEYLRKKKMQGNHITIVNDGHWNKLGNQLVGEKLIQYFSKVEIGNTKLQRK